jgi:hypothetical protein
MSSNNVNLNDVQNQLDVMHVDNHQDHLLMFLDLIHKLMKHFDHANDKIMVLDQIVFDYTIDTIFQDVE